MGKTFHKAKTPLGDFKVTTLKNSLTNNQMVMSIRNLITTLAYPKKPTEPSLQYLIELDLVVAFFPLMHKSPSLTNPLHGSQYMINSSNFEQCCSLQNSSLHQY